MKLTRKGTRSITLKPKLLVSKNVVFYDHHFPFHYEKQNSEDFTVKQIFLPAKIEHTSDVHDPFEADENEIENFLQHNTQEEHDRTYNDVENNVAEEEEQSSDVPTLINENQPPNIRKSSRILKRLAYLEDYCCTNTSHWCGIVEFKALNSVTQLKHSEPNSYKEALLKPEWKKAMDLEIVALERNKIWDLVNLPRDKKAIGS